MQGCKKCDDGDVSVGVCVGGVLVGAGGVGDCSACIEGRDYCGGYDVGVGVFIVVVIAVIIVVVVAAVNISSRVSHARTCSLELEEPRSVYVVIVQMQNREIQSSSKWSNNRTSLGKQNMAMD